RMMTRVWASSVMAEPHGWRSLNESTVGEHFQLPEGEPTQALARVPEKLSTRTCGSPPDRSAVHEPPNPLISTHSGYNRFCGERLPGLHAWLALHTYWQ